MEYSFAIHGHENVLATHARTIEFTKDAELTKNGDCIVGVKAEFFLDELKKFLHCGRVKITVEAGGCSEAVTAVPNKKFNSSHELVIRLGEFDSERTFAVRADKAAVHLGRELVAALGRGAEGKGTISA